MKDKLITFGVVMGGMISLAIAKKLGADSDWLSIGASALAVVAGCLHSMVMEQK